MSENKNGGIYLHNNHAIGLQPEAGRIGLYKPGDEGWIVGIRLDVYLWHFREAGLTSGFMNMERLELSVPAEHGMYVGRIEGWDYYKTEHYSDYFKPQESQFLPNHVEWTTFAWLDAFDEEDPYFYYGWGLRMDMMPPYGYRRRTIVAHLGVNFPIGDDSRPTFTEIPPEDWLIDNMRPSAPDGQWELKADLSSFTVDDGVLQETSVAFRVWEGRSRFVNGILDYVKQNDVWVGEEDQDLSGVFWGSMMEPGELKILSGPAAGMSFRVVYYSYSGNDPSGGFPANTWLIKTHPLDPVPSDVGVTPGTEYRLESPFNKQVYKLVEYEEVFGPGMYPSENLVWKFSPVL